MKFLFRRWRPQSRNLIIIALENYPGVVLRTGIGITLLGSPLLLNLLSDRGVEPLALRILYSGMIIVFVPTIVLFIITLLRAPKIRRREADQAATVLQTEADTMTVFKQKEAQALNAELHLKQVREADTTAQQVKDQKNEDRWDLLEENFRLGQVGADKLSTDQKEEREVVREKLATAQKVQNQRNEDRWDSLEENMRLGKVEDGKQRRDLRAKTDVERKDLATQQQAHHQKNEDRWEWLEENMRQGQMDSDKLRDDQRNEREEVRAKLETGVLKARQDLTEIDNERWNSLHERLRVQEEDGKRRDQEQARRDAQSAQLRREDKVRAIHRTLLERYIRHAERIGHNTDVADGLSPMPIAWLKEQPEIKRTPALLNALLALEA